MVAMKFGPEPDPVAKMGWNNLNNPYKYIGFISPPITYTAYFRPFILGVPLIPFKKSAWNPNDPCFDWNFGLVLGGWPSKMEVIWVLGVDFGPPFFRRRRFSIRVFPVGTSEASNMLGRLSAKSTWCTMRGLDGTGMDAPQDSVV